MKMKSTLRLASLAMLAAGLAAPAFAQTDINVAGRDANDVRTVAVNSSDLDLATSAGRFALHTRITKAVRQACSFGGNWTVDSGCAGDADKVARAQAREMIAMANTGGATAGGAH
jgi:UrcA family protein